MAEQKARELLKGAENITTKRYGEKSKSFGYIHKAPVEKHFPATEKAPEAFVYRFELHSRKPSEALPEGVKKGPDGKGDFIVSVQVKSSKKLDFSKCAGKDVKIAVTGPKVIHTYKKESGEYASFRLKHGTDILEYQKDVDWDKMPKAIPNTDAIDKNSVMASRKFIRGFVCSGYALKGTDANGKKTFEEIPGEKPQFNIPLKEGGFKHSFLLKTGKDQKLRIRFDSPVELNLLEFKANANLTMCGIEHVVPVEKQVRYGNEWKTGIENTLIFSPIYIGSFEPAPNVTIKKDSKAAAPEAPAPSAPAAEVEDETLAAPTPEIIQPEEEEEVLLGEEAEEIEIPF